jgi:hypothetical protein
MADSRRAPRRGGRGKKAAAFVSVLPSKNKPDEVIITHKREYYRISHHPCLANPTYDEEARKTEKFLFLEDGHYARIQYGGPCPLVYYLLNDTRKEQTVYYCNTANLLVSAIDAGPWLPLLEHAIVDRELLAAAPPRS